MDTVVKQIWYISGNKVPKTNTKKPYTNTSGYFVVYSVPLNSL